MNNIGQFVKVERISCLEEALECESLGVSHLSVSLYNNPRFRDERQIGELNSVAEIKNALKSAELVLDFPSYLAKAKIRELVLSTEADFFQVSSLTPLDEDIVEFICDNSKGLIYSGFEVSYDEDPSWVFSDFDTTPINSQVFFQLDLLPEVKDAWRFLKEECPNYPEELQVSDVKHLSNRFPLIITTNFNEKNVTDICNTLDNIRGISFVLGEKTVTNDFHYDSYDNVVKILRRFNRKG